MPKSRGLNLPPEEQVGTLASPGRAVQLSDGSLYRVNKGFDGRSKKLLTIVLILIEFRRRVSGVLCKVERLAPGFRRGAVGKEQRVSTG